MTELVEEDRAVQSREQQSQHGCVPGEGIARALVDEGPDPRRGQEREGDLGGACVEHPAAGPVHAREDPVHSAHGDVPLDQSGHPQQRPVPGWPPGL